MLKHDWKSFLDSTDNYDNTKLISSVEGHLGEFLTGYLIGNAGCSIADLVGILDTNPSDRKRLILALWAARYLGQAMSCEQVKYWMTLSQPVLRDNSVCDLIREGYTKRVVEFIKSAQLPLPFSV